MNEKYSFEKKNSDYFNDNNSVNFETKEQTTKNEQDDENEESNEIKY